MVAAMGSTKDHRYPQPHLLSVKGKRTKRPPRTGSPAALTTLSPSSSSSSYTGTDDGGGDIRRTANTATSSTTTTATASSAEYPSHITRSTTTAEEEEQEQEQEQDMANCLILLAQGSTCKNTATATQKLTAVSSRRHQQQSTISVAATTPKAAVAAAANMMGSLSPAAAGVYPYECKTCNRCFPSFQALGGHRASHKKPKPPPPTELDRNQPALSPFSEDGQSNEYNSSLSLQIGTCSNHHPSNAASAAPNSRTTVPLIINKPKVHECTICGAEFSSGQALGGHMRRHRALLTGATAPASAVSAMHPVMIGGTPMTNNNQDSIEEQEDGKRTRNLLALDLNLPAPEEDHRGDQPPQQQQQSKFVFKSNDNTLFFSAPSLVDCHH